jgi:predicted cupin superfamily sugar epimerase
MKFWNKDKRIRQTRWHRVEVNRMKFYYSALKRQLQLNGSTGKFYIYYGVNAVWFEREADAVWFGLTQA